MSLYDSYQHLLRRPYLSGRFDCYGLARDYYKDVFGVEFTDFARPELFWQEKDLDIISNGLAHDGWQQTGLNTRHLKIGDGLVFAIASDRANHLGVYVGNGMFIHHYYKHFSTEEPLTDKWKNRLLTIVRHKNIQITRTQTNIMDLLPDHVKRQFTEVS